MKGFGFLVVIISSLLLSGCAPQSQGGLAHDNVAKLPSGLDFFISPQKDTYRPYEKVTMDIPLEDTVPLQELLQNGLNSFFDYEFSARMYNKNWSTYDSCPKERLPYEKMRAFVKKYPHFYLVKALKKKLKRTKRIIVNEHTQYDVEDINQINILLNTLGS